MGSGVGEGSTGCVLEAVAESGLGVGEAVGVPVAGREVTGLPSGSVGAAGAQADRINTGIKISDDQKESRRYDFIVTFFPGCDLY